MTAMTAPSRLFLAFGLCALLSACSAPKFRSDFTVAVTFTPAAVSALKAANEGVTLDAYYYGAPAEATKEKANEAGQIELGEDFIPVDPAAPNVHIAGNGIDQVHLTAVADGKVQVEVRAYSGTDRANLFKCTPVTAALADLQARPATLACDAA
jgi:hypothetical protein